MDFFFFGGGGGEGDNDGGGGLNPGHPSAKSMTASKKKEVGNRPGNGHNDPI